MVTGIGWHWKSLVTNPRVSNARKMVVCGLHGVKTTFGSTSMSEQRYSMRAVLTSHEEGPGKGGLKQSSPL